METNIFRNFNVEKRSSAHKDVDDLIDRIKYYLANDSERERIALNDYKRVHRDYRLSTLMDQLFSCSGIARIV